MRARSWSYGWASAAVMTCSVALVGCADHESAAPTRTRSLVMKLHNYGSTNFPGWQLFIYSDGSGELTSRTGPRLPHRPKPSLKPERLAFRAHTFSARKLAFDLDHTNLSSINGNCLRSASFGAVETLSHDSKSVTGIDCYIDAGQTPLARELRSIVLRAVPRGYSRP